MKKNKLSFLIVSSLLAIASLVGCNSSSESESKAGESNSIASSESSQKSTANSSSNSQGAQSSSSSLFVLLNDGSEY